LTPGLGANVRFVDLHNATHVTSGGGYPSVTDGGPCADSIITRFVQRPAALHRMNVSCATQIPPIQTVAAYPRTLAAAPAATVVSGHASLTARRAAWVAAQTAGEALLGSFYRSPIRHVGRRGRTRPVRPAAERVPIRRRRHRHWQVRRARRKWRHRHDHDPLPRR
jgi:hypothetical protein